MILRGLDVTALGAASLALALAPGSLLAQNPSIQRPPQPYPQAQTEAAAQGQGEPPQGQLMPPPGTVNYMQGQVSLNGSPITAAQTGRIAVQPDDSISTGSGRAEILLTPGVFLRIGDDARVRMASNDLADPRAELVSGEALVEVDRSIPNARVDILERGSETSIAKAGLYRFDANAGSIAVYDGKADVHYNDLSKEIGKGRQIVPDNRPKLKSRDFDRVHDELYAWSNVRSGYLAEANASTAKYIYAGYGPYRGTGWYWSPYYAMWSWLPGDGFFWSPFGYPFFSVAYVPYYVSSYHGFYGGWRGGLRGPVGRAGAGHVSAFAGSSPLAGTRGSGMAFSGGAVRGGFAGGGFHGGAAGRR